MSRLRFRYFMRLSFDGPAAQHRFTLKCIPVSDEKQNIALTRKDIFPNSFISESNDSFGNSLIYGYEESEHKCFFFDIRGEAVCGREGIELQKDLASGAKLDESVFKYPTKCTEAGKALREYSRRLNEQYETERSSIDHESSKESQIANFTKEYYRTFLKTEDISENLRYSIYIMNKIYQDFKYQGGVTGIGTTAEEAFRKQEGVCQDYAHIMLALLRLKRIPCRYVTGMMIGEGESHAWIEVYTDGFWLPLDPTNGIVVTDQHIKIAHGRDYSDCLVNQGVFVGKVRQSQDISVYVKEVNGSTK